jgi:GNAT superfamily N-acetyltransferase
VSSGEVVIRRGDRLDVPFLRSLLGFAYNWHVAVFDTDVSISRYVDGWGRRGDTALIAMQGGHSIGAAWYRLFPETSPGYAFLDAETPEVTAVVVPTRQGQGIGAKLLGSLVERAKAEGYPALSVSVRRDHADAPLFSEQGFEQVREEGETLTLRRSL